MTDHDRASTLLPWLANGRLQGEELAWLNSHLTDCAICRDELSAEQRIRAAIATQPTVEFAPQASFNRLWERIEADAATVLPVASSRPGRGPQRWRWLAAGIAAQLLVASVLGTILWQMRAPDFRTVTAPVAASTGVNIQVVFDNAVTLGDVKDILGRAGVSAVSGPTPAGVYTLQPDEHHRSSDPASVLATLRADPRIRFAELSAD